MPSYNFNPIRIPDNSVWRGKMFHFTYPSFISISTFLAKVSRITSIQVVAWSYAHEYGTDEDGECKDGCIIRHMEGNGCPAEG